MKVFLVLIFASLACAGLVGRLADRVIVKTKDVASFLRYQAQEFGVETSGVAFRHFRRFMLAAGGAPKAKKLLLEAVDEFANFVRDYKPEMLKLIREALVAGGDFVQDNEGQVVALYRDVRGEVERLAVWLRANLRRKSPQEIFEKIASGLGDLCERHEKGVADLMERLLEETKDFKKKHRRLIRKLKREIKDRADEFDDDRDHEVDDLLDDKLDTIANGFVIEYRFNVLRYKMRVARSAVRAFFKARPRWRLSSLSWNAARTEEEQCREACVERRSWREALLGWTQERSSVAGRTLSCETQCSARHAALRPNYLRYVFETAMLCDPQNGAVHHVWAKLSGNKVRHEGYVTCARRQQQKYLIHAVPADVAKHRHFFDPDRVVSIAAPRVQALARDIANTALEQQQ